MLIAKIENNNVVDVADYTAMFPDTSFPASGPDEEFMIQNSCMYVNVWLPYDPATQVLEPATPYIMDGWVYTVAVREMTPEELANYRASVAAQNQAQAIQILNQTDWAAQPSVADPAVSNPYLMNQPEWLQYRSAVRQIAVYPTYEVVWPVAPVEEWSK